MKESAPYVSPTLIGLPALPSPTTALRKEPDKGMNPTNTVQQPIGVHTGQFERCGARYHLPQHLKPQQTLPLKFVRFAHAF